jgi:hypothetical protein
MWGSTRCRGGRKGRANCVARMQVGDYLVAEVHRREGEVPSPHSNLTAYAIPPSTRTSEPVVKLDALDAR